MTFLWFLIWLLIVVHLSIAVIWVRLFRIVIKKEFSRKILNRVMVVGSYAAILFTLLASLIIVSLERGRRSFVSSDNSRDGVSEADEYGFVDVRGQVHVHSYLSHDSRGTLDEITQAARKNGVRWIILTDHIRKLPPGDYPDSLNGVLIIYGCETNGPDETSVLCASLKDPDTTLLLHSHVEGYRSSGGPALMIGGFQLVKEKVRWNALELVNFHANVFDNKLGILRAVFFDPESIYDNLVTVIPGNFIYWQQLAEGSGRPMPIFGAPDVHQNQRYLGLQADPYELIFGLISTHVWLESDREEDQNSIFEAIRKGRTYIAFDCLGDPTGFQFCAKADGENFFTGDVAVNPWFFDIGLPDSVDDPSGIEIKFYRDNYLVETDDRGGHYNWEPKPGFWRVEVWKNGRLWIISGQILVK